ncbi:beta-amylase 8-like [Ipomoea triloba]|uniref:beta-amylase 8-like n=1 Tax=Ipomoea triloba TaxID=35885 RepID=UPI00125DF805|nr:beta-amylase 8-like [Ipomoea triloba]
MICSLRVSFLLWKLDLELLGTWSTLLFLKEMDGDFLVFASFKYLFAHYTKISGIHWWYKTSSHAAELTAGYYNTSNQDGYSPLFEVLKKHNATMKFVSKEMETQISPHDLVEASADPNGLCLQVLNGAWDEGLAIAGHHAPRDYNRETFMRLVETSKPRNDHERYHCSFFVLERPWQRIQTADSISELEYFVKCMHGYA